MVTNKTFNFVIPDSWCRAGVSTAGLLAGSGERGGGGGVGGGGGGGWGGGGGGGGGGWGVYDGCGICLHYTMCYLIITNRHG